MVDDAQGAFSSDVLTNEYLTRESSLSWTLHLVHSGEQTMYGLKHIGAIVSGISGLLAVTAIPLNLTDTARSFLTTRAKNAVPSAPRFVIYSDKFVSGETGPPSVDMVKVEVLYPACNGTSSLG